MATRGRCHLPLPRLQTSDGTPSPAQISPERAALRGTSAGDAADAVANRLSSMLEYELRLRGLDLDELELAARNSPSRPGAAHASLAPAPSAAAAAAAERALRGVHAAPGSSAHRFDAKPSTAEAVPRAYNDAGHSASRVRQPAGGADARVVPTAFLRSAVPTGKAVEGLARTAESEASAFALQQKYQAGQQRHEGTARRKLY